jgi:putative transcriptional regulator
MSIAFSIALLLLAVLPGVPQAETALPGGGEVLASLPEGPSVERARPASALESGKFLVASRKIIDPFFSRSVVLLISYGETGAMGLIINRPTEMRLSDLFPEVEGLEDGAPLFFGGPVERQRVMLLVRTGSEPKDALRIFDGVYISASSAVLKQMAGSPSPGESFRVYSGYAGWARGQLEAEIARGDWHVLQADAGTVFDRDPREVWPELITHSSGMEVRAGPRGPLP